MDNLTSQCKSCIHTEVCKYTETLLLQESILKSVGLIENLRCERYIPSVDKIMTNRLPTPEEYVGDISEDITNMLDDIKQRKQILLSKGIHVTHICMNQETAIEIWNQVTGGDTSELKAIEIMVDEDTLIVELDEGIPDYDFMLFKRGD